MATTSNLNGIKENIRSVLETANTTTASPIDLSDGLATSNRVKYVMKVNPNKIRSIMKQQNLPLVTMWIDGKSAFTESIAGSQANSKRISEVTVEIMGMLQNIDYSNPKTDEADEDIEKLMENIELILRSNTKLGGTVLYQIPESVEYHSIPLDNRNHIRVGLLSLRCKVQY